MPGTYEDPGCFCKFCCPLCAVYQAKECACPDMAIACCLGCWYTMFCWDPEEGKPAADGVPVPATESMERK